MAALDAHMFVQEGVVMIIVEAALLLPQEPHELLEIIQTEFALTAGQFRAQSNRLRQMNVVYGLLSFTDSIDLLQRERDPGFTITCVEIKISRRIHACSMAWRYRLINTRLS